MKDIVKDYKDIVKDYKGIVKYLARNVQKFLVYRKLKKAGMVSFFSTNIDTIVCNYNNIKTVEDFKEQIKKLHSIFPKAKMIGTSAWSPFDDRAMYEKKYAVGKVTVSLWFQSTVSEMPKEFLREGCAFEPVVSTSYTLKCKR